MNVSVLSDLKSLIAFLEAESRNAAEQEIRIG